MADPPSDRPSVRQGRGDRAPPLRLPPCGSV